MKYIKLFSEHEILRELVKNCEVLLYSFLKVFGCCRRYLRSVSYLPVIGSAHTDPNISKESTHGDCLLILLDNRSNITL